MAIARLSVLQAELGITTTVAATDNVLKSLLAQASKFANHRTGRALESTAYTDELYRGGGGAELWLNQYPVTTLSAVKIWDGDAYTAETSSYYELVSVNNIARIIRYPKPGQSGSATYGAWPRAWDVEYNIKVSYTAGYITTSWDVAATTPITAAFGVPEDLEWAVARMAAIMFMDTRGDQSRLGIASMTSQNESLTTNSFVNGLPKDVLMALDNYRDLRF